MKSPKSNLDLHPESRTSGLAFVVMYAMAHFLLLACVTLLYMFDTTLFNDLLTMKVLIAGHIVINLFILLPISYMFGNQNNPESLTMTRMKGYKSEKSKSLLGTLAFPIALYISSIAMFHFISVLFGAPLIKEVEKTCHFAALLSSSAVLPSMIIFGCSMDKWVRIFINHETMNAAEYVIKVTSVASIVGAWLGAFPIPLDWDRHWQLWPVSCTIGSVLGFNLGLLGGIANIQYRNVRYGKKQT